MKGLGWRGGVGYLRFNSSLSILSLLPDVFEELMGR